MAEKQSHKFNALYLASELPISKIKGALPFKEISFTRETALYKFDNALVYVYSFGSVVFVDTSAEDEKSFVRELGAKVALKSKQNDEIYEIAVDPAVKGVVVTGSAVYAKKSDPKIIGVVARILAQSVALEAYEDEFKDIESEFRQMNKLLGEHGRLKISARQLMRMIARNNVVLEEIVSGIGVLDKPDAAWDSPLLDMLHVKLADEFELQERFQNINSKMAFVQENYRVFLESLRSIYDANLEWVIIILIVIEIALFIYELFGH
jgi:uncharacterized Rmd1/YagE family protein